MTSTGAGTAGSSSSPDTTQPYASGLVGGAWMAAGWAGAAYGLFLTFIALRSAPGADLTGHWVLQPAFKASMAILLAVAAFAHPIVRERRCLMPALLFSAAGDWLLAIPWFGPSFVAGLGAFLVAHVCYLLALMPLAVQTRTRLIAVGAVVVACGALLVLFWPNMIRDRVAVAVTIYIAMLCAMACAAQLARLPTPWTALGAMCFVVSDGMIGIGRFVLESEALAVPIWWAYALAQILITAGFFFGRSKKSDRPARSG